MRRGRRAGPAGLIRPTLILLLAGGCAGSGTDRGAPTPAGTPGLFVAGYHPWWAGEAWSAYPLDVLDRLYLFEVELAPDGGPGDDHGWPERWSGMLDAAREAGVSVVPTVTLHPEDAVEELLSDPAAVSRAVRTVGAMVADHPAVDGIHLDLEIFRPIAPAAREGYVALARQVRRELDRIRPGRALSVFVPALDVPDAYDEAGLAAVTDYLVVQGYDLHHRLDTHAGPVAPVTGWGRLNWSAAVDRLTELGIPPEVLVMGVPLYGYRWPTRGPEPGSATRGPGVTMPLAAPPGVLPELPRARDEVALHGMLRDPESGVPYYVHLSPGGWVQGWFEDEASLATKVDFVRRRGLGGVAFFPLSYATPEVRRGLRGLKRGDAMR